MNNKIYVPKKKKIGKILLLLLITIIAIAKILPYVPYFNDDEAAIQECLDKFSVACSDGNFKEAAKYCSGYVKAAFIAAGSINYSYKGFGIKYDNLSQMIMPLNEESMEMKVRDFELKGKDEAFVTIQFYSKNKYGEFVDEDKIRMKKMYGLFWKIVEI